MIKRVGNTPRRGLAYFACIWLFIGASVARADVLLLKSGDRISGTVTALQNGTLTLESAYSGTLSIPQGDLAALVIDAPVFVTFRDGTTLNGSIRSAGNRALSLIQAGRVVRQGFTAEGIIVIDRTKERTRRFVWTGNVGLGFSRTDGNSDTETINASASTEGRSKKHRIKLGAAYNRETDSGTKSVDDARVTAKHDRFVSDKLYFYTSGSLERDDIANLDLRAVIGTGLGYQIFDSDTRKLSVDAGPSFVHEQFDTASNQSSAAFGWTLSFLQAIFSGRATFFHDHEATIDITNDQAFNALALTGVRVPLFGGLNASAEIEIDYDSNPPAGTQSTDLTYRLMLGYAW